MKLTYERLVMWKPGTIQTQTVFHVFDRNNPTVLLAETTSLDRAKKMAAGKIPVPNAR
jgi:hypothetical protein